MLFNIKYEILQILRIPTFIISPERLPFNLHMKFIRFQEPNPKSSFLSPQPQCNAMQNSTQTQDTEPRKLILNTSSNCHKFEFEIPSHSHYHYHTHILTTHIPKPKTRQITTN
jgi:hypothetical protein